MTTEVSTHGHSELKRSENGPLYLDNEGYLPQR